MKMRLPAQIPDWEIFNESSLPDKDDFYSHVNMADITDAHYTCKKNL